ncbi:MAG: hypothetical protein MZV64_54320 [Ignavibacteriales bacterium]|nr:hypothetical protein [Ignavibacteriales bacterium]
MINKTGGEAKDTYEISIPSQTELRIDWKVKITNPTGEATLNVSALTDEESDAMEVKVPIIPNGIKVTNPVVLRLSSTKMLMRHIEISFPENIDIRTAKFVIYS